MDALVAENCALRAAIQQFVSETDGYEEMFESTLRDIVRDFHAVALTGYAIKPRRGDHV
jgi:hypothetical protein